MHPRTREVLSHLDGHRADLERAVADAPSSIHATRPSAERWSVAEILEHLVIVESRISQMLQRHLAAAREAGLGQDRESTPVVPTLDVAGLLDRTRRIVAGEASQPTGRMDSTAAWSDLRDVRARLRSLVLGWDGLALQDVALPHPRLGSLNAYQWLVFLGAHEGRHAAQTREVVEQLGHAHSGARTEAEPGRTEP